MPFTYQQYRNPYIGSIADLLQHQNDPQARAAEQIAAANAHAAEVSGQAYAGMASNLGQIPGQIVQQVQQAKHTAQQDEAQKLQIAQGKLNLSAAQRLDQTKQQISALMNNPDLFSADGTINPQHVVQLLGSVPGGGQGPTQPVDAQAVFGILDPINAALSTARQSKIAYEEHKTNAIARIANSVLQLGKPSGPGEPDTYLEHAQVGIAALLKSGQITPAEADSFLIPMVERPEMAPQVLQQLAGLSTTPPIKLGEKERLVSGVNPLQTLVPAANETSNETELALKAARGDPEAIKAMALLKPPPSRTAEMDDQKFRQITADAALGKPVSTDDAAWAAAYKTQKTLGVDTSASAAAGRQATAITAQTEQQKRAQAFTEAQAGRKELTDKVEVPYQTALGSASTLREVVAAAQSGNKVAGSLQSLETTMAAIRAQGLNRINTAEIGVTANAGTLWDRMAGWFGKAEAGQPVPANIQKDMLEFAGILEKSAYKRYIDAHQAVTKRYGLTDERPLPSPDLSTGEGHLLPGITQIVVQNGVRYSVTTDIHGKVVKSEVVQR